MYDFSAEAWRQFDQLATRAADRVNDPLPTISLDLWFEIAATDLYRVIELIPSLDWQIGPVGLRIELAAKAPAELLKRFHDAKAKATPPNGVTGATALWPKCVTDYLIKNFEMEFEFRYWVLDRSKFDADFAPVADYRPAPLEKGKSILSSLFRVSFMKAQRHLSGETTSDRAEELSRRLGRFYESHLKQHEAEFASLQALQASENQLNLHFEQVFKTTLDRLRSLGYPGLTEAEISIRAALNAKELLKGDTNVHYALRGADPGDELLLPDRYNGLGYKNLIYMVIELLDYQHRWESEEEDRALLHLVIIEEPEAHLHTQMQQVFIREIRELIKADQPGGFHSQLVITTHSPHILHAAGFTPIRYFRRKGGRGRSQHSEVLNLSRYYDTAVADRDFLQRYLELTHCDLFFADAAILVEGTVERLLLPAMINKSAKRLNSCYLSVLEVGGAYGHVFRSLIDFLGLTTLIITDLDSVRGPVPAPVTVATSPDDPALDDDEETGEGPGSICPTDTHQAVTSNQTLRQWLPQKITIADLLTADVASKTQHPGNNPTRAMVRVAYQVRRTVMWKGQSAARVGRTFEEDFALQNLEWCQDPARKPLKLGVRKNADLDLAALAAALHKKITRQSFQKTEFALALIGLGQSGWTVPQYIDEGLKWLEANCSSAQLPPGDPPSVATFVGVTPAP